MKDNYITDEISDWLLRLNELVILPSNIIALNFGFQKVYNGYEFYLSGHDYYCEKHDDWLMGDDYLSSFFAIGQVSLRYNHIEIEKLYKKVILAQLKKKNMKFLETIDIICISYVVGKPQRIK